MSNLKPTSALRLNHLLKHLVPFAACLASLTVAAISGAQLPNWPPGSTDGNLVAGSGTATVGGHTYSVSYDGINSSASISSGPPLVSFASTGTGTPLYKVGGVTATGSSVYLDNGTGYYTSSGPGGTLDRILSLYCQVTAGSNQSGSVNIISYPFFRYKVTTSDPNAQNAHVMIRIAQGLGGNTGGAGINGGSCYGSGSSFGDSFFHSVSSWMGGPPQSNAITPAPSTLWVNSQYVSVVLSGGVGYFWAEMTPESTATISGLYMSTVDLIVDVMPIDLQEI